MLLTAQRTIEGDRDATIFAMIAARTWRDQDYRDRVLSNPKETLAEAGLDFSDDTELAIVEETDDTRYVVLPADMTDISEALAAMQRFVPLADGYEIRLVQNTAQRRYLVLPAPPRDADAELMTAEELVRNVPQGSFYVTTHTLVGASVAVATQAVVTGTVAKEVLVLVIAVAT